MAFDYQTLKKVTGAAIVDGTLGSVDLANTTVTDTSIATGAVAESVVLDNDEDIEFW